MCNKEEAVLCLTHKWGKEYFITAPTQNRTNELIEGFNARPLATQIVGWRDKEQSLDIPCPATSLSFPTVQDGFTTWAIEGLDVQEITIDGETVGTMFEDDNGVYLRCAGVKPDVSLPPGKEAARQVFSKLSQALASAGMDFSNVVRTWFYNDDILSWYDEFNEVRTAFFEEAGVFQGLVPASTGIGATNAFGAAMMTGLFALKPKNEQTYARKVASPLQCPPSDYGSSFSRAASVKTPQGERLFISGTASVAPEGHTAFVGDLDKQIDLTFKVVKAILAECSMNESHVTRAIAYLKKLEFNDSFQSYVQARGLSKMPLLTTVGTICRDDLLFEIELDAYKATNGPSAKELA